MRELQIVVRPTALRKALGEPSVPMGRSQLPNLAFCDRIAKCFVAGDVSAAMLPIDFTLR